MKGRHRSSRAAEWPPGSTAQAISPTSRLTSRRKGWELAPPGWPRAGQGGSFKGNPRPERRLSCPRGISWSLAGGRPQEDCHCALKNGGLGWAGGHEAERSRERRNQNSPGRCLPL